MTVTSTPASAPERLITARELADHLGTTPRWVIEKAREGVIPRFVLPSSNRVRFQLTTVLEAMRNGE
jgi:hypothetical protein